MNPKVSEEEHRQRRNAKTENEKAERARDTKRHCSPPAPKKRPRRRRDVDESSADLYFHLARVQLYDLDTDNKLTAALKVEDAFATATLNSKDAEERRQVLESFSFVMRAKQGHEHAQNSGPSHTWWCELLESKQSCH